MTAHDPILSQTEAASLNLRTAQPLSDLLDGYYQPQPDPASAQDKAQQELDPLAQMFAYFEA